jgi:MFS family permease
LRVHNYRLFFIGHTVSTSGTWMQRVAQDWLVYELTGDPVAVGIATALQFAPVLLFGLWGGVVADRVDRRKALALCQAAQLVLALGLGVLTLSGLVTVWLVFALSLLLGVVTVIDQPVRQALVSDLVDRDAYANAQVFNSTAHNLGKFIGPACAGVVIAVLGAGVAFLINAASFVAMLVGLWRMDPAAMQHRPRLPRGRGQARAGLRYVWRDPTLRTAMWLLVVVALLGQNYRVVFPVAAVELFDGDAATYGWLMAMLGLGAIVGAVASAARERATLRGLIVATLAFAGTSAALAVSSGLAVAAAITVGLGVAHFAFNTLTRTVLLLTSDLAMHGRVMALHGLVFLGSNAIGGPLLGWVCSQFGARAGLLLAAGSALIAAAVAIGYRRSGRRQPAGCVRLLSS